MSWKKETTKNKHDESELFAEVRNFVEDKMWAFLVAG